MKGYWPLVGDRGDMKLRSLMRTTDFNTKKLNFNREGYWPLTGNAEKLSQHNINVDKWPFGSEHAMPEQKSDKAGILDPSFYTHFMDTGSALKKAGITNKWWDQENFKRNGVF